MYGRTGWQDKDGTKVKVDVPEFEWIVVEAPELRIVPDELWRSVHGRLSATREQYLRWADGKLLGRPSSGVMSDYLLTGLGICGICGGALTVRTKGRSQGRATYQCLTHTNRGADICPNGLKMDLQAAEAAVRDLFAEHVLRPDVVAAVIEEAVRRLRPSVEAQEARRGELRHEVAQLDGQIGKLTEAIALGGVAGRDQGSGGSTAPPPSGAG